MEIIILFVNFIKKSNNSSKKRKKGKIKFSQLLFLDSLITNQVRYSLLRYIYEID